MKKSFLFLFILIIVVGFCACSNKTVTEKGVQNRLDDEYYLENKLICDELDDAVAFDWNPTYFATKDKVYKLSVKKLFSNDKNCKEVEIENLDSNILEFMGNGFETEGYQFIYSSKLKKFVNYYDNSVDNRLIGESFYKKWFSEMGDHVIYSFYGLKKYDGIVSADNKMKMFDIEWVYPEDGSEMEEISYADIDSNLEEDEIVLEIQDNIVKTNKTFYEVKAYKTNKEECEKYEDVKCKYGFKLVKNKFLTKNYDFIKFANNQHVIDINNNYYTLGKLGG